MAANTLGSGLSGFIDGWRFGREMVEGDATERAARAAAQAALAKQAAADRKAAQDWAKFSVTAGIDADKAKSLEEHRKAQLGAQVEHWDAVEADARARFEETQSENQRRQQQWESQQPYRDEQYAEIAARNERNRRNQAFQEGALSTREAVTKALSGGELTPDEFARVQKVLPFYTQDAAASQKKLTGVFNKAATLYQAGDVKGADAVFSSPEGTEALSAAFGPMFSATVGTRSADGKYVTTSVTPVGIFRDPTGEKLGINLKVQRELAPEIKQQLTEMANNPNASPEIRAEARQALLMDNSIVAPLTEGRTPVGEGGTPKFFSSQDMQIAGRSVGKVAQWRRDNPEEYETALDWLDSASSASTPQEAHKLFTARRDSRIKEKLTAEEKALERQSNDKKALDSAWASVVKNLSPAKTAYADHPEILTREQDRVARIAAEGSEMIRNAKGPISVADVYRTLSQKYPPTQLPSDEATTPAPTQSMSDIHAQVKQLSPEAQAVGTRLSRGEITKEEAIRLWEGMGIGR